MRGLAIARHVFKDTKIRSTRDTDCEQRIPVTLSDINSVGHLGNLGLLELFSGVKRLFDPTNLGEIVPTPSIDLKADTNRGVLLALRNSASFYREGKIVNVDGPKLMAEAKPYAIYPGFAFVGYPNRDSTPYKERSVSMNFFFEFSGV